MSPAAAAETPLLEVADRFLDWMRSRLPTGAQAEIFLCRGRERGIEIREGRLETLQESMDEGVGLRVIKDGRMGFAYSAGLGAEGLARVLARVLEQLPFIQPNEHRALPAPAPVLEKTRALASSMTDTSLFRAPLKEEMPRLREMEALALRSEARVKRVLRLGYGESSSEIAVASTLGVRALEGGTHASAGLAVTAERGAQVQVGSGGTSARFHADLDLDRAAREAAYRAGALLDAEKLPTRRRAVVFDPWVSGEFLEIIAGALSADVVQRGKSLFAGKLGAKVAGSLVDLIDDPWLPRGIASASFDDEGVPTARKTMMEGGVLKDFYYDTYTARKDGRASNGAAGRASYKGTPSPSSSNLYMKPGPTSRERLLADTPHGILLLEVMGMHTADPVTGEFSVGISGVAIEGGRLTRGVRGAMLSGSVLELLGKVDAVADDLTFYGRLAAPTFRVAEMMVA